MSDLPHVCTVFPEEGPPAIAVTGDLRVYPILIADWQPGVLSEPFELAGNGTYRLKVTPVPDTGPTREWIACPNCGRPGSIHNIVLADVHGQPLAGINLATFAHSMAVAIFGRHGVMVQTVRRDDITMQGPYMPKFCSRNFRADAIEWA